MGLLKLTPLLFVLIFLCISCTPQPSEQNSKPASEVIVDDEFNSVSVGGKIESVDVTTDSESDSDASLNTSSELSVEEIVTPITISGGSNKKGNLPPTIIGEPTRVIFAKSEYLYFPTISDPNGDKIRITGQNIPLWLKLNKKTGALTGVATRNDVGIHRNIYINVSDGPNKVSQGPFSITVEVNNSTPVISGSPELQISEGEVYQFIPEVADADGDQLEFVINNKPNVLNFNTQSGELSGIFSFDSSGIYSDISIGVSDGITTVWLPQFSIEVTNVNLPPEITGVPTTSVVENTKYTFLPSANDPDGDLLEFQAINLPSWLTLNTTSGLLQGQPTNGDVGIHSDIELRVTDGKLISMLPAFSITVIEGVTNTAPSIFGIPNSEVLVSQVYQFVPKVNDVDGDQLSFSIKNLPGWLSFNDSNGEIKGIPDDSHVGTYSDIAIAVSDGIETATLPAFSIVVKNQNTAPKISGSPDSTIINGQQYLFLPSVIDSENDVLLFSIQNKPTWLSFNAKTGELLGTPIVSDVGQYSNIIVSVSDGTESASLSPFTISVLENSAPIISGIPDSSVSVSREYLFTPTVVDVENDMLTFAIKNKPIWMAFDENKGSLSGVPALIDVGTFNDIVISVSDGLNSTSLQSFSITVQADNNPPSISGTPIVVTTANNYYSFQPSFSDIDGDTLTLSISNKPSWALFDSSTGLLSGTPSSENIGIYENILISVSDSNVITKLDAFSITINPESGTGGEDFIISNISQSSYELDSLFVGVAPYVDRNYTVSNIPEKYFGANIIRTMNDHKNSVGENFLSFNLSVVADVYVAFDSRITSIPTWLSLWESTGTEFAIEGNRYIIYKKYFPAGPVSIGGNYGDSNASMYSVFATSSSVIGDAPIAKPDLASTTDNQDVQIFVLDNDENLADTPVVVTIENSASYGITTVFENQIIYSPQGGYVGGDSFVYRVSDVDGDFSVASVNVEVLCGLCLNNVSIELNWMPNPDDENVSTYNIYFGKNGDFDIAPARKVNVYDADFDSQNPVVMFDAGLELGLQSGDAACFKISATNIAGESPLSDQICESM